MRELIVPVKTTNYVNNMVKNLKLGDLSITGLNDINRFSIPVKNLFPDFDDSILRK